MWLTLIIQAPPTTTYTHTNKHTESATATWKTWGDTEVRLLIVVLDLMPVKSEFKAVFFIPETAVYTSKSK